MPGKKFVPNNYRTLIRILDTENSLSKPTKACLNDVMNYNIL